MLELTIKQKRGNRLLNQFLETLTYLLPMISKGVIRTFLIWEGKNSSNVENEETVDKFSVSSLSIRAEYNVYVNVDCVA